MRCEHEPEDKKVLTKEVLTEAKPKSQSITALKEFWHRWILGGVLPVYFLTTLVGTIARVDGDSMNETLRSGDVLILLKYPRWLHAWGLNSNYLKRGDIVIFKAPADSEYSFEMVYGFKHRPYNIKRVVALAGDTVAINNGELFLNGKRQQEVYASEGFINNLAPYKVPSNKIWVMGDNRRLGASLDSRAYGAVDLKDVAGPTHFRLWHGFGWLK